MALVKPQFIANLLVEKGNNPEFIKLDSVAFLVIKELMPSLSEEEVLDYLERFSKDIASELFIKENDGVADGYKLNFDIKEEDDGFYIKFLERTEIKLLRKLQTDTAVEFEKFCKDILEKLGGLSSVTGGTNDGGIDFTAFDLKLNNMPLQSTKGSRISVIGQAKRYKDGHHVTENELRHFIGCCVKKVDELKRTRSDNYGILQPTILAFWTTSDFHSEAKKYAKDLGIWYLNGVALSQLSIQLGLYD